MAEKSEEKKAVFDVLNKVNVNEHTETKDTGKVKLTYLSWAWAWAEAKKRYPDANYEIIKFNGIPYVYDEKTGYMVYTTVTIEGITHEMWLPVMDGNNRAMKADPYKVTFKNGSSIIVQAATMMDINKTIMRCLAKNLAMFGLGLYIYAGEDLPADPEEVKTEDPKKTSSKKNIDKKPAVNPNPDFEATKKAYQDLIAFCQNNSLDINSIAATCGLSKQSTKTDFENALAYAENIVRGEM
jgi:hypothetical protein